MDTTAFCQTIKHCLRPFRSHFKIIRGKALPVLLLAAFALCVPLTAYAGSSYMVNYKNVTGKYAGVEVTGKLPQVQGLPSKLQAEINSRIGEIYTEKVNAAKEDRAKSLDFAFETKTAPESGVDTLLIETTFTTASSRCEIESIHFDPVAGTMVTLNDLLGVNALKLANQVIVQTIAKEPDKYNNNFTGITDAQSFYVDNQTVILVFDDYAIAPGAVGTVQIPIQISEVKNFVISHDQVHTKDDYYALKMIPLRNVCEEFGWKVDWNASTKTIDITRGNVFASLTLEENRYYRGKMAARTLESAPELRNGVTYAPITFFDEILGLTYGVDAATGDITFSEYIAKE